MRSYTQVIFITTVDNLFDTRLVTKYWYIFPCGWLNRFMQLLHKFAGGRVVFSASVGTITPLQSPARLLHRLNRGSELAEK